MRRMLAFALTIIVMSGLLSACGGGNDSVPTASQGAVSLPEPDRTQPETPGMDVETITDPFLAVSGVAGDAVVARVGEYDISAAELLYWLNGQIENYLVQFRNMGYSFQEIPWDAELNEEETMEDTILNSALETAAFYRLLPELSRTVGLELTQEELDFPKRDLEMSAKELGSEEALTHWLWFRMMDESLYTQLYHSGCLFEKLQDYYYGEGAPGYPGDEEVKEYAEGLGYYRVKHILLKTAERVAGEDGSVKFEKMPEEVAAEKWELAEKLIRQLEQAEDPVSLFDELMNRYSEDPGLAGAPDGYTAYPGQMVAPFEEGALALSEGEISGIVESDDGLHIILRLPLELDVFRKEMISQRSDHQIMQWLDEYGIETTQVYQQIDPSQTRARFELLQTALQEELERALASVYEKDANSGES